MKAEIDHAFITIGDPVVYTLTATHDAELEILSGFVAPAADVLKIKKVEDVHKKLSSGKKITGRRFILTSYQLGEFILEPVKIEYRNKDGALGSAETNRLYLTVHSVAEGEEKYDIRGIKSVLDLKNEWVWLFWILMLGILAGGGFFIYEKYFKPKALAAPSEAPPMSLEEQTIHALHALFDSDLLKRGKYKEYYLRLSEILRTYFEKRYQILAIESTTYEIMRSLIEKDLDKNLSERISVVLEAADLAKFAKWKPEPTRVLEINKMAVKLVEDCRAKELAGGI
ncbi:MAG: hypothetical protein HYZ85_03980 [Candidatus Omnitrophica bacterium]|nr:hypothetical protein [Candidatus Omnitrophota bacterium]